MVVNIVDTGQQEIFTTGVPALCYYASGMQIGIAKVPGDTATFAGVVGEVLIYNRLLTDGEIMQNYLATKWRYR